MSFAVLSQLVDFSRFIAQKMDWHYFHLSVFASGMYLFNIIVISVSGGRLTLINSTIVTAMTNFPLLTLVYVTALLELMDMKVLFGGALSRIKKRSAIRPQIK
jgi:hypothetical protein